MELNITANHGTYADFYCERLETRGLVAEVGTGSTNQLTVPVMIDLVSTPKPHQLSVEIQRTLSDALRLSLKFE